MFVLLYPLYYLYLTNCNTLVRNNETFLLIYRQSLLPMKCNINLHKVQIKLTNRISITFISWQKWNKILSAGNSRCLKSDAFYVMVICFYDRHLLSQCNDEGIIHIAENRDRVDLNSRDSGINSASIFVISQCWGTPFSDPRASNDRPSNWT